MQQPKWTTALACGLFAVVVLLPLGQLGLETFWLEGHLHLKPFRDLLFTSRQWGLLQTSLLLASGTTLLALIIGLPFAFFCQRSNLRGRSFFALVSLIPLLIPPYMQAIVWSHILAENGLVNQSLMAAFNLAEAPLPIANLPGAIFVLALAYFPFVTLMTMSGLRSVDSRYEEAALQQHGSLRTITRITLPLAMPHIFSGAVFVFVFAIIDFGVPDILRLRVYPVEIFIQFSAFYNEQAAVVLSLPLLCITMILISLQVWYMRGRSYVTFADGFRGNRGYDLGWTHGLAAAFCLAVIGLSVVVPIVALLQKAGPVSTYQKVWRSSLGQIGYSFLVAAGGAAAMTVLAFFLAHCMIRATGKTKMALDYLTQLPFAVPAILLGIGLIKVWNRPLMDWLYGSAGIVVIGYVAHFIPFTIRAISSSLKQLNPHLEEMSCLATDRWFRVAGKITLPLISTGILSGFFISFILAMGDLGVTLLVVPPGSATLPVKIFNFMHYGAEAMVAALCLTQLCLQLSVCVGLLGVHGWLVRLQK